jgi:outer membrane protein OmpA-like peptidoglycan-associated protein
MAHDVFISHSSKDKAVADAVCAILEEHKIRCWIAPRDITPGKEWGEAIIEAIGGSWVMILIFSASANGSPQIRREVERAVNKEVVVVPIRIENVVPTKSLEYFIGSVHWLDALTPPLETHLEKLIRVVEGVLGSIVDRQAKPAAQSPGQSTENTVTSTSVVVRAAQTVTRKSVWQFAALGTLGVVGVVFAILFFAHRRAATAEVARSSFGSTAPPVTEGNTTDSVVLKRAKALLVPPPGVTLSMKDGKLIAEGVAPVQWIARLKDRAPMIAGVTDVDITRLQNLNPIFLDRAKTMIESNVFVFPLGKAVPEAGQEAMLASAQREINEALNDAASESVKLQIELIGHTDSTGIEAAKPSLSKQRADAILNLLTRAGVKSSALQPRGVGTSQPLRTDDTDEGRQLNRSVTFRVDIAPAPHTN